MPAKKGHADTGTTIKTVPLPDGSFNNITQAPFSLPVHVKAIQIINPTNPLNVSTDGGTTSKPHGAGVPFSKLRDGNELYYIGNIEIQGTLADNCSFEIEE